MIRLRKHPMSALSQCNHQASAGSGGRVAADSAELDKRLDALLGPPESLADYGDCIEGAKREGAELGARNRARALDLARNL